MALKTFYAPVNELSTSNGGCHREEKSRKHWSFFTKLLSLVTANLFFSIRSNQEQLYVLIAQKIREKNRTEPNELDELKYSK